MNSESSQVNLWDAQSGLRSRDTGLKEIKSQLNLMFSQPKSGLDWDEIKRRVDPQASTFTYADFRLEETQRALKETHSQKPSVDGRHQKKRSQDRSDKLKRSISKKVLRQIEKSQNNPVAMGGLLHTPSTTYQGKAFDHIRFKF
jgi:hypothetical protein